MIPDRFPDEGQAPEYNTVDATLWYFEAIRAYHEATGDDTLLRDLFPVLQDIVDWHVRGIRYQIHFDPADGLLYAGERGVELTRTDAKVIDWVVTPPHRQACRVECVVVQRAVRHGRIRGSLVTHPSGTRHWRNSDRVGSPNPCLPTGTLLLGFGLGVHVPSRPPLYRKAHGRAVSNQEGAANDRYL